MKIISSQIITALISLLGIYPVFSQTATLQGVITDFTTAEPLYGANVMIQSTSDSDVITGTSTDNIGFFQLSRIEPGEWLITITYIGYATYSDTLYIAAGEVITRRIPLEESDEELDELVVSRIVGATRRIDGAQRITPTEIRKVPSPAAGDLTSYLQTLPGVVTTGDRGGQIFIRGGSPSENMVLVDGAILYQPAHILGFYSPIPGNMISSADFFPGGFGPKYTGRTSSVMDIQLRSGNTQKIEASGAINPFAAEIFSEGPYKKGSSSWLLSFRNSIIDRTSKWYPISEKPVKFQSQILKNSFIFDETRCSALLMHSFDSGRIDPELDESIQWRNFVTGLRCTSLPGDSGALLTTNMNLSRFSNSVGNVRPFAFSSDILRFNLDVDIRQYKDRLRFDYGAFTRLKYFGYDLGEKFIGFDRETVNQFITGAHAQVIFPIFENVELIPGLGATYNGDLGLGLEPRFRFNWYPFDSENQSFFGSAGLYLQPIAGISDSRDVSSVFVAWMSAPAGNQQSRSVHTTFGWQQSFSGGLTWSAEAYHKKMKNLVVPVWDSVASFTTELAPADGRVYGTDLRVEYNRSSFYGLIGYGFNWTQYQSAQEHFTIWFGEPVQTFHPPHDRRHQFNSVLSIDAADFTFGIRWQYGTGLPFTQPIGFDEVLDFRQRLPNVNTERGTRRVVVDRPFEGRMPAVHRLDFSISREFSITQNSAFDFQAGVINMYDQSNIFYYDVFTNRRVDQLTFSPYLTVKLAFR